jgi:hypothetical protein
MEISTQNNLSTKSTHFYLPEHLIMAGYTPGEIHRFFSSYRCVVSVFSGLFKRNENFIAYPANMMQHCTMVDVPFQNFKFGITDIEPLNLVDQIEACFRDTKDQEAEGTKQTIYAWGMADAFDFGEYTNEIIKEASGFNKAYSEQNTIDKILIDYIKETNNLYTQEELDEINGIDLQSDTL